MCLQVVLINLNDFVALEDSNIYLKRKLYERPILLQIAQIHPFASNKMLLEETAEGLLLYAL